MQENAVAGVVVVDRDRHRLRLFTTASAVDIMSPSLDRHDRVHRVAFPARTFIGLKSFLSFASMQLFITRLEGFHATPAKTMAARSTTENHRIPNIPESMFYIPDFISHEEEATLLSALPSNRWIQLQHRRLQTHPSPLSKTNTLLEAPLPRWLVEPIISKFKSLGLFSDSPHQAPNHVLINEYKPLEGIMPHEDGAAYYPIVATVSLSSTLCLDIYEKAQGEDMAQASIGSSPKWRVLQEPRSLLVTTGAAYTNTLHGISEIETDENLGPDTVANWTLLGDSKAFADNGGKNTRSTRVSLTYRDVLKVSKAGTRILGRPRG